MSSSASPAPALPLVRDCRPGGLRPLLAPGGRDTYFAPDIQRMLFSADEPIARFLPPAKWAMPDRQERAQEGKGPQVAYTIPDEIIKTARPLAALPRAEIDAFAEAVIVFLSKARPEAKGVTPYMRQCRQEFRLPDPVLDPAAYWVYGPEFDQRLLILWGCEQQAGSSLSLEATLEKLRAHEMSWLDKQQLALKLALRPDEGLARFLAPRSAEGGLVVGGHAVPAKKLNRLKYVAPKEWQAFDHAAKAYYAKAHPEVADIAPFEKELRREFRLPSLEQVPGDFYTVGSHLVIALDAWPRESTLPATDDPKLKLPEPPPAAASVVTAAAPSGGTVSAQLKKRLRSPIMPYIWIAAAVLAIGVIGTAAWLLRPDRVPPEYRGDAESGQPTPIDERTVALVFSEPLAKPSLQARPPAAGAEHAQPPFVFFEDKLKVSAVDLSATDPRKVFVHTETPFKDGEEYGIAITQVADLAGNVIKPTNVRFTYYDRRAPKLVGQPSAGPTKRQLLLTFSKPISEDSLNPSRFAVYPIDAGQRGHRIPVDPQLFKKNKAGTQVILEAGEDFKTNSAYQIDITGVTDRAVKPNPVDEASAMHREFNYIDLLPPSLEGVVATGGLFQVVLEFDGPVDPTFARDESHYTFTTPENAPVRFQKSGIQLDDTGSHVTLAIEPGRLSTGSYKLVIAAGFPDQHGNKTDEPIERVFAFNDAANHAPPVITKPELSSDRRSLRLLFDRTLARDVCFSRERYRILDSQGRPSVDVRSVEQDSSDPARAKLVFARAPGPGRYFVETNGLADVFGSVQDKPERTAFSVSGVSAITTALDWTTAPSLKGQTLTVTIPARVTKASAGRLDSYEFDPAVTIDKLEVKTGGSDEQPLTIATLHLARPVVGTLTVAVHDLILEAAPNRAPLELPAKAAELAP